MWAYLVYQPEYINAKRKMISFNIGKYEPDGRDVILSGRDASHCMSDDIIHETEQCFCMAGDERQAVMGRLSEKKHHILVSSILRLAVCLVSLVSVTNFRQTVTQKAHTSTTSWTY